MSTKTKKHAKHVGEETVSLRHDFNDKEYRDIGGKLNIALNTLAQLEHDLAAISKDYKARIAQQEGIRDELNNKLGNGYEMRQTKVAVVYDPKRGVKTFFAADDKKQKAPLGEEPMRQSDYQIEIPIPPQPANVVPMQPGDPLVSVGAALNAAQATPAHDTSNPPPAPQKKPKSGRKPTRAQFKDLKAGEGERDK